MLPRKATRASDGNQFPVPVRSNAIKRRSSPSPFPRSISHTQLNFPEDGKMDNEKLFLQEQEESSHQSQEPEGDYYYHEEVNTLTNSMGYLCLGGGSGGVGVGVNYGRTISNASASSRLGGGMSQHNHLYSNVVDLTEDDSEFVSTSSSSFSSASSFVTASPSPSCRCACASVNSSGSGGRSGVGGDVSPVSIELKEVIEEKLAVFYRFCSQTKGLIKEFQARFEELPFHCRLDDLCSVNYNLEKLKGFRKEVDEVLNDRMERSKMEMETILRYSELLMPSEESRMSHDMTEIDHHYTNLDQDIGFEIEGLENFSAAYQSLQGFLQERVSRFSAIKTRLVQVERNLVKNEGALTLRLKGLQSILSVLERDHDSSENSEISRLIAGIRLYDYIDIRRVMSQTHDLIQQERLLLEEVRQKRVVLMEARVYYSNFVGRLENFQGWYNDYMRRLSETKVTGPDFDQEYPTLVMEREEKRKEFIEILASARKLRASIFDSSAVDERIEILQSQWKVLVEKVYRARSRKTV